MSKLFFFDIDGTLIDCNKGLYGISTINRNSFDQLKQKGHDVFLATGANALLQKVLWIILLVDMSLVMGAM